MLFGDDLVFTSFQFKIALFYIIILPGVRVPVIQPIKVCETADRTIKELCMDEW